MSNVHLKITLAEDLKREMDLVDEGNTAETLRKALVLYLAAKKRTEDGNTKLGFFDSSSLTVEGEVIGL
jgi:hypothetical protein